MKAIFINPKEKSINEILLSKKSEDSIYLVKIWDSIRLLLDTEVMDSFVFGDYDEDGYVFYRQQDYSSEADKYWVSIEGIDKTEVIFGNSLLIFPNSHPDDLLKTTIEDKITFLDDYKIPAQDFDL